MSGAGGFLVPPLPPAPPVTPPLEPRPTPYLWVTWLAKYLVGEVTCVSGARGCRCISAIGKRKPMARTRLSTRYTVAHTALLRRLAAESRALAGPVLLEAGNAFQLPLPSGLTLAGKPDLVAFRRDSPNHGCEVGPPKASHVLQVQIYQWALPLAVPRYQGWAFEGCVAYADGHREMIPPEAIDNEFEARLLEAIAQLGSDVIPYRAPSRLECRYCPIASGTLPGAHRPRDAGTPDS